MGTGCGEGVKKTRSHHSAKKNYPEGAQEEGGRCRKFVCKPTAGRVRAWVPSLCS